MLVGNLKKCGFQGVFCIRPPPGLLPVLGPLEQYMMPTLDAALLCSSRAGSHLDCTLDWFFIA